MQPNDAWRIRAVGEMAKVMSGYAFKSSEFQSEGIPVIKIKNIRDGYVDLTDAQCVDEKYITSIDTKFQITHGDLLISLTGSHITQPGSVVGRVARYLYRRKSLLNQRGGKITITKPNDCDVVFLFYMLTSNENSRTIALMAQGAASQANVSPSQVEGLKIPIPEITVQRKIGAILSAYDDLIENNKHRIKILEEIARLTYQEWFVDYHFPGYKDTKIVDSPIGKVPEGWDIEHLSVFTDFEKGVEPGSENYHVEYNEGIVPFLRVGDLGSRQSEIFITKELCRGCLLQPNDIAITMDGTVGLVRIGLFGAYSSGIRKIVITNSERLGWGFTYFLLKSDHIQGIIHAHAKGTTIKHASSSIEHLLFLLPPIHVMESFENHTSTILKAILNLSDKNKLLKQSRDLLLPKLISGEIDVSELDIDIGDDAA